MTFIFTSIEISTIKARSGGGMCEKVLMVNKPEILVPSRNFYKGSFRVGLSIRLRALR